MDHHGAIEVKGDPYSVQKQQQLYGCIHKTDQLMDVIDQKNYLLVGILEVKDVQYSL